MSNQPLAYVYVRWSRSEQGQGDSETRQLRDIGAWCERRGFAMSPDRVLIDRGASGFAGAHLARGKLGEFIRSVETGRVPHGSVLVVEQFDRISRLPISEARRVIDLLTRNGIKVGVVGSDDLFDAGSNDELTSAVGMLLRVHLAHDESRLKRDRQRSIWVSKRAKAAETQVAATNHGPRWLDRVDGKWILNRHAPTVARIYQMSIDGFGAGSIATKFNAEAVPGLSRAGVKTGRGGNATRWSANSIRQLLRSHAPRGAWLPRTTETRLSDTRVETAGGFHTQYDTKTTRAAASEPIEGYYPAVVSQEDWDLARRAMGTRTGAGGNKGVMRNVLQGLAFCPQCKGRIQRHGGASGAHQDRLFCYDSREGQCSYKDVVLAEPICQAVLDRALDAFDLVSRRADPERQQCMTRIGELEGQKASQQGVLDRLITKFGGGANEDIEAQFDRIAVAVGDISREIASEQRRLLALESNRTDRPAEYEALIVDYKTQKGEARDRAVRLLNAGLKQIIDKVHIWVDGPHRGEWWMTTTNDWARTGSDWPGWKTDLEAADFAERQVADLTAAMATETDTLELADAGVFRDLAGIDVRINQQRPAGRDIATRIEARTASPAGRKRAVKTTRP